MVATYTDGATTGQPAPDARQGSRQYLFDTYIERMLSRGRGVQRYGKAETLRWLGWLARQLHERSQSEFLLEKLQPSWIESLVGRAVYRAGVLVTVALSFAILELTLLHSTPGSPGRLAGLLTEITANGSRDVLGNQVVTAVHWPLVLAVAIGLVAGVIVAMKDAITPIETVRWSWTLAGTGMRLGWRRWSGVGLSYGAYLGLIAGLVGSVVWQLSTNLSGGLGSGLANWGRSGQLAGTLAGVIAGVATLRFARAALWQPHVLRGWRRLVSPGAVVSGLIFALVAAIEFQTSGPATGLLMGALSGLGIALFAGLTGGPADRPRFGVSDGVIVGVVGWVISGSITWLIGVLSHRAGWVLTWTTFSHWMGVWLLGWIGLGAAVGLVAGAIASWSGATGHPDRPRATRSARGGSGSPGSGVGG